MLVLELPGLELHVAGEERLPEHIGIEGRIGRSLRGQRHTDHECENEGHEGHTTAHYCLLPNDGTVKSIIALRRGVERAVSVSSKDMPLQLTPAVPFETLVLIGGGEFSFGETREIDELLLSRMPAGNRTIALPSHRLRFRRIRRSFRSLSARHRSTAAVVNVPVFRGRDNRRQKNVTALQNVGMIYLGGGVTNNLAPLLRESPVELAMREAATHGVIVAAIGAAASCFGIYARDMRGISSAIASFGWWPTPSSTPASIHTTTRPCAASCRSPTSPSASAFRPGPRW